MRKPDLSSTAGNLEEVADLGRLFLGYFLLAKQKKVTSCRATPANINNTSSGQFSSIRKG